MKRGLVLALVVACGTPAKQKPAAPQNLRATASDQQVLLEWDAVADAEGYTVTVQEGAGGRTATTSEPRFVHTPAVNGRTYDYLVRATNGDDAAKISATPASPLEGWVIGSVPGDVAAIAYGGGVFVASSAGKPTTKVLRSTDGTTWTDSAFPGSGLGRVVFTQGKFYIAAFTGGIYSSADGVSWATEFTPATMGRQIAAAEDGTIVVLPNVVRANGAWSNSASNLPATVGQDVAFGAGRFVAVSGSGAIYSSTNAITWQEETDHPAVDSVHSLRFTGDRFVALGSGGAGMGARLLSSSDGRHWTMVTPDEGACPFADVAFAQGIFVTVGAQQRICTSSDLSVWRLRETIPALPFPEPAGTPALSAVIYANGKWVAVGENTGVTHP